MNVADPVDSFQSSVTHDVPDHVPRGIVRDFNVYDCPLLEEDPQGGFKKLQETHPPLFFTPRQGGHWVLLDAKLIEEALKDPARFSSRTLQLPRPASFSTPLVPAELDPPEHGKYRKLLMTHLSPKAVAPLADKLRSSAIAMIESVRRRGNVEFVGEIARRFPVFAFLQLYGLPLGDAEQLVRWMHMSYHDLSIEARQEAVRETYAYFDRIIVERRANPGEDLFSRLVNAQIDGEPIEPGTLRSMLYLVLVAGLDTVTESLSFSMRFLADNPTQQQFLRDEPTSIPDAVEELLRRFGPIWMTRLAKHDFEFGGQPIKEGDQFLLPMLLIGMDERTTPRPLEVDFTRRSKFISAFGMGPHNCIGAPLARLEMRIFLEEWLRRVPAFAIAPGSRAKVGVGITVVYMENLDLEWQPDPA